jgi:NAD(P)-dependent dehydrogenase (short-subunit alcohol dehydrogenase family)
VECKYLDLSSRESIDKFAEEIKAKYNTINILVNNAGVSSLQKLQVNKDNIEMQMAINHFGHFYLTYLLWDELKNSKDLRIINVSSRSQLRNRFDSSGIKFDFEDLNGQK